MSSMAKPNKSRPRVIFSQAMRLSVPVAFALTGFALYVLGYRFDHLSEELQSTGTRAPFLFGTLGVAAMSMMVPKTVVSLSAGALFGSSVGCLTMFFTAIAAAALNYGVGRFWIVNATDQNSTNDATSSQEGNRQSRSSTPHPIPLRAALIRLARQAGFGMHLLIRLTPVPTSVISYSMGATKARFVPYLTAAALGVIPQFLYVHAASMVTEPEVSQRYRYTSAAISLVTAIVVSVVLPKIALKRIRIIRDAETSPSVEVS